MTPLETLKPRQLDEVRSQVRGLLENTEAFRHLPAARRQQIASDLVKVVGYLADPVAGQKGLAHALLDAGQQPTATENLKQSLAGDPKIVQGEFKAPAATAGAAAMTDEVKAVNFPGFVSSLIQGVFQSIVDASIRQMEAYQKLLEAVAKSVEQYAGDHVSPNQARDYLVNKYPRHLGVDTSGETPKLMVKEGAPDQAPDFKKDLGLSSEPDPSDEAGEKMMVEAAQLQMAKMRQQQLSTMVLMGINRIVVTDGLINAKVLIDVKTKDKATRKNTASMYDAQHDDSHQSDGGGWFSGSSSSSNQNHDVTVSSAREDKSTSSVDTHASLTGEVRVNFKSETFPLEKLASPGQIADVSGKAKPA